MMTRLYLILPLIPLTLAACTPAEQRTAIGTLGGAAVGAAVSSGDDRAKGALVGAAVGAAAATLIGPAQTAGQCVYRDQYGRQYTAAC
jgi:outer membrane lipoprotein SlyB